MCHPALRQNWLQGTLPPRKLASDPMKPLLKTLATMVLALFVAGCAGTGAPGQPERRAESLAQAGRHAEAADAYIGLASSAEGVARDRLTLLAVEQWLDAGDGRRARNALRDVRKPTSGELVWLWNTDVAAMYLYQGRPDDALNILEPMSREALPPRYRKRTEALRGDAWFQKGDPARAVGLYLQLENWLDDSREIDQTKQRLWAGLLVGDPRAMRAAAEVASDEVTRGWLTLGALAASTGQQGIGWANGIVRWQQAYPGHPAMTLLDDMVLPDETEIGYPRKVALLLPVSGKNGVAGEAIRNGFFGAYFAAAESLDDQQEIVVYDVERVGVSAAYSRAIEDGAEFVVGPLLRRDVQVLASEAMLPVPVLALNYLPDDVVAPPGFYQFALAPEDEAASAAVRALADGSVRAVALYPNNDWGRRVASRFATELESNGGLLLDQTDYQVGKQDFSLEIENLMGLTQSVARYQRMRANLGEPLQFDPRRRQDIDFVFLAADGGTGRLIKSQLKFHYAGDLPVYSTSFIYSLDGRSNRDLNGVMFADTPWMIDPRPWMADYPALYAEYWPAEKRMGRLHAMGFDAYNLISGLYSGSRSETLVGATGDLYLDADGRVHRRLAWARFEGGVPVAVSGGDAAELPEDTAPDDAVDAPTEWRPQQLNR